MSQRYNYDRLRSEVDHVMKGSHFLPQLYESINNISRIIVAICNTNDDTWIEHVTDKDKILLKKYFST